MITEDAGKRQVGLIGNVHPARDAVFFKQFIALVVQEKVFVGDVFRSDVFIYFNVDIGFSLNVAAVKNTAVIGFKEYGFG